MNLDCFSFAAYVDDRMMTGVQDFGAYFTLSVESVEKQTSQAINCCRMTMQSLNMSTWDLKLNSRHLEEISAVLPR